MLKLINTGNNYIVFLLAQLIVPFLKEDYFNYSKESISNVLLNLSL